MGEAAMGMEEITLGVEEEAIGRGMKEERREEMERVVCKGEVKAAQKGGRDHAIIVMVRTLLLIALNPIGIVALVGNLAISLNTAGSEQILMN